MLKNYHHIPRLLVLPVFLLAALAIEAQEIRVNDKNEKIIVYPDGSWQYFTIFGGSSKVLFDQRDEPVQESPNQFAEKYPVYRGESGPGSLPFAIPEEYARSIAIRKTRIARDANHLAKVRASEAKDARQRLEIEAAQHPDMAEREKLARQLELARIQENTARTEALLADRLVNETDLLTARGIYLKQLRATQRKINRQEKNIHTVYALQSADLIAGLAFAESPYLLPYEAMENMRRVPTPACHVAFEGIDQDMQQYRKDLQKQRLFSHTDARLRPFLKEKEYLSCDGFLTAIGSQRYLTLQFTFAYPNAREAYGIIEKGSMLTVKLLDGSYVNLKSGRMDKGSYDTRTGLLTYNVHYTIDPAHLQALRNSEVNTIYVFWSSGYEEYPVYEVDFFIHQLACLDNDLTASTQ
jgi:hypothetical protein